MFAVCVCLQNTSTFTLERDQVGEVVMERNGHMVGVVVSWDPEMRAPAEWIKRMYSGLEVSS